MSIKRDSPDFTIGIEEEYLLTDAQTGALVRAPDALMKACRDVLGDQVSPEFLQCQIEVGTGVCANIAEARSDLSHLRRTVAGIADEHGLKPIAASCHPFSDWRDQSFTDKDRYRDLERDLRGVAHRMLICGMHVHVGIADRDTRIDLCNRLTVYLPHLLALSASSPFWSGADTGLSSYRLSVFDNMPRTGLPPHLDDWADWRRKVAMLTDMGVIEDASKIWWDLRPSEAYPTLETRICDVCPRLEDTLTLVALVQSLLRMLWRTGGGAPTNDDLFLTQENRWRAQRFGLREGLIDMETRRIRPVSDAMDDLIALVAQDAAHLGATTEVARTTQIVKRGTAAAQQRAIRDRALQDGADRTEAMRAVVRHLAREFTADL
ncbi:carboxylate-amine ligase [Jannaschia faecimaris]|uniref:Putative glutamate--cysteine ligase 2 n=1 Tax=Jannaschia faecimaris TaxID=1244108 RepID=A0A1H3SIM3_9RHOB|nr:carboxylate-amine ligase [Jannaschia faecimaris]SDZ37391.1 carboxylate-amine ligase [Jannaschia faecimaris]